MQILENIFGSAAKVKIMRLFLFNPRHGFDSADIRQRTHATPSEVRTELLFLEKAGFIRKKIFYKDIKRNGESVSKKKTHGWVLDDKFPFLDELEALLVNKIPLKTGDMVRRIIRTGKIKLIIVAGIFIQNHDSRIDLLVVGDHIRRGALEKAIRRIEAEVGRELKYAVFETEDFMYRISVYDKLVRDILDYPHHKVFDKLAIK